MKVRDIPQRGSRGNVVAARNRSGQYLRERVSPDQPASDAQCAVWGNMTVVSRLWNLLEEEQRVDWGRLAEDVHSRPTLGQSGPLSGCQLFKKLNRVLATCRRQPLLDPPPRPQFGPNPVEGFVIRNVAGRLAFILQVSRKFAWKARPALEDLMLYSWTPLPAGTGKNTLYAFLGLLPPPVGGEIDFTSLYLRKLAEWRKQAHQRYHVPLEGSKIFIRVWQQMNGWEHEVGVFQASALVRADGEVRARKLATLLRRWPTAPRHQ